jgi:hypothetical protein
MVRNSAVQTQCTPIRYTTINKNTNLHGPIFILKFSVAHFAVFNFTLSTEFYDKLHVGII